MKYLFFVLFLGACSTSKVKMTEEVPDATPQTGQVSIIQVAGSDSIAQFNVVLPRLANYEYVVTEKTEEGPKEVGQVALKNKIQPMYSHWKIHKVHARGLQPEKDYHLVIRSSRSKRVVEERIFRTMNIQKSKVRFVLGSCLSDEYRYEHVQQKIWKQMYDHKPDFILLTGDIVYVDAKSFVKRKVATEFDIWTRYISAARTLPVFKYKRLIPILATWDDHDYGTNNGDKTFKPKKVAQKAFKALFGGESINGIYTNGEGVSSYFTGYGHNFFLMDDRYFREPTGSKKKYAHWGEIQHKQMMAQLESSQKPTWLVNGNQFFGAPFTVERKGEKVQLNESFMTDHKIHFKKLIKDLKGMRVPIAFASGDIHFSEIMRIEKSLLDYQTYEVTSSPIHAYVFRPRGDEPSLWKNGRRLEGVKEYNFIVVDSKASGTTLTLKVESYGPKQEEAFFSRDLQIIR